MWNDTDINRGARNAAMRIDSGVLRIPYHHYCNFYHPISSCCVARQVMKDTSEVRKAIDATQEMFEPLHQMVVLLKQHGVDVSGVQVAKKDVQVRQICCDTVYVTTPVPSTVWNETPESLVLAQKLTSRYGLNSAKYNQLYTKMFEHVLRSVRFSLQDFLEEAPMSWDALVKKTFRKKEEILPMQMAEVGKTSLKRRSVRLIKMGLCNSTAAHAGTLT